jgi:hypothetical protein
MPIRKLHNPCTWLSRHSEESGLLSRSTLYSDFIGSTQHAFQDLQLIFRLYNSMCNTF